MPAVLEPGKKLRRIIKVYGIESPVEVSIAHEGIAFRVPGTKLSLMATWPEVIEKASTTPDNVPSKLAGEPMKFLADMVAKAAKRKEKRAAKKAE